MRHVPEVPEGLRKLTYGNKAKFDFEGMIRLVAQKNVQVSAMALEAVRISINRELKTLGEKNYRLQINSAPHHIVREHGLIGVAKAERFAKGMRLGFGKSMFRMARVKRGKTVIDIMIHDDAVSYHVCKKALTVAMNKLPATWKIMVEGISRKNIFARVRLPKRIKKATGSIAPKRLIS